MLLVAKTWDKPKPNIMGLGCILKDDYIFCEELLLSEEMPACTVQATIYLTKEKTETVFIEFEETYEAGGYRNWSLNRAD